MITLPHLTRAVLSGLLCAALSSAHAKLPAPSPEAKAAADEAKAKTAHGDKVAAYKLCLAMDRTVAHYVKTVGQAAKPLAPIPPCADPGPFVYAPEGSPAATAPVPVPGAAK